MKQRENVSFLKYPNLDQSSCYGCGACTAICPKGALVMKANIEGFYYPSINRDLCVNCGACINVCPAINQIVFMNRLQKPNTYIAWNKNSFTRYHSSSGGVFYALAEGAIEIDGIVFGAVYDDANEVVHVGVSQIEKLSAFEGSKYVQGKIGTAYNEAKKEILNGRCVLFSGTPCQIAGLYGYLGSLSESADLITCEVICHGVPSQKVFGKYLSELRVNGKANFINFRDKRNGWRNYYINISYGSEHYTCLASKDPYFRLFNNNVDLRQSCVSCAYARLPRIADITIGDFWGISAVNPEYRSDDRGFSIVLGNSEKGNRVIKEQSGRLEINQLSSEMIMKYGNKNIYQPSSLNINRSAFYENIDKYTLRKLADMYCLKYSLVHRGLRKVKRVVGEIGNRRLLRSL